MTLQKMEYISDVVRRITASKALADIEWVQVSSLAS